MDGSVWSLVIGLGFMALGAATAFQGLRGHGPHSRGVTVFVGLAGVALGVVALVLVR